MLDKDHRLIRNLDSLIQQEIRLHKRYQEILSEERTRVTQLDAETVRQLTVEKQTLNSQIHIANQKRISMVKEIVGEELTAPPRLRDVIAKYCHPDDAQKLMDRAEELRLLVEGTYKAVKEFGGLVDFSLGMVNSVLSIIWSASQDVVESYSSQGAVRRSYSPGEGKPAGVSRKV